MSKAIPDSPVHLVLRDNVVRMAGKVEMDDQVLLVILAILVLQDQMGHLGHRVLMADLANLDSAEGRVDPVNLDKKDLKDNLVKSSQDNEATADHLAIEVIPDNRVIQGREAPLVILGQKAA